MTVCSRNPPSGDHCPHEYDRPQVARWGDGGSMVKTEKCCHCGELSTLRFKLTKMSGHGPFAPMAWVLVEGGFCRSDPRAGAGVPDPPGAGAGSGGQAP
jgi:hypothetical protein